MLFIDCTLVTLSEHQKRIFYLEEQTFTNEVFAIYDIPTTNPPTYSLIEASQEPVKGKFYELGLVTFRENSS